MANTPTNIITRSEASHRLKLISTHVSNSVGAAREGHWNESAETAVEARRLLDALIPHLEEAAGVETELLGSLPYNPPKPDRPRGGMGYRGSNYDRGPVVDTSNTAHLRSSAPPPPIDLPKPIITPPPPRVFAMPPTDAPQPAPAPEPEPAPEVIRFETATFDLSRIPGTPAWNGTDPSTLTPEECAAAEHYYLLSPALQEKIERRWAATRAPVTVKLRPVEVKVGVHNG